MGMSGLTFTVAFALSALGQYGPLRQEEKDQQNKLFEKWWGTKLVWKFDDLPAEGSVPEFRVPYSGYIYPDLGGGTMRVLRKYDIAFNGGRMSATSHEQYDTTSIKEPPQNRFGRPRLFARPQTPHWFGHCNGWTAAAIRHAEPQDSVTRNGVTFTPADIKGLLAEIYMYQDTEILAGSDAVVHPAMLHVILTNWLGRGQHPIGMDTTPGREVWNHPIYSYTTTSGKHSDREVEVKMNVAYAMSSMGEFDESPRIKQVMYFHYLLNLDSKGTITGGQYYGDSWRIDLLWAPRQPVRSGAAGNERGNPFVDVKTVLAVWRASVPEATRKKWLNIDPSPEDRVPDEPPSKQPKELAKAEPNRIAPKAKPTVKPEAEKPKAKPEGEKTKAEAEKPKPATGAPETPATASATAETPAAESSATEESSAETPATEDESAETPATEPPAETPTPPEPPADSDRP